MFPGKRMPGHLGNARRTIQKLEIVRIDAERQLLLVKGSVPGSKRPRRRSRVRAVKAQAPKAGEAGCTEGRCETRCQAGMQPTQG